jgi:hypothetical protein
MVTAKGDEDVIMKTDVVLTMKEYLNGCCGAPHHIKAPAKDARHVPIAAEKDVHAGTKARNCTCDRWGHPCPDCDERKIQPKAELPISSPAKKTS